MTNNLTLLYQKYLFCLLINSLLFNTFICLLNSQFIIEGKYPKIKPLSSGKYFLVYDKGLSILNSDFSLNKWIYNFTENETIESDNDYKNIAISEFELENNSFISCLLKGYFLYIYDIKNDKIYNNIKFIFDFDKGYTEYNLITHRYNNSTLEYIFYYINSEKINYKYYYQINFFLFKEEIHNLNQLIIINNSYIFKDIKNCTEMTNSCPNYSTINERHINCQNIKNESREELICFYEGVNYQDKDQKSLKIVANIFEIGNFPSNISYQEYNIESSLSEIKSVLLEEKNIILIGYIQDQGIYDSKFLVYDIKNNSFQKINIEINNCKYLEINFL